MIYALNSPSKQVLKIYRPVFYPGLCATFKYIKFLLINIGVQGSGFKDYCCWLLFREFSRFVNGSNGQIVYLSLIRQIVK